MNRLGRLGSHVGTFSISSDSLDLLIPGETPSKIGPFASSCGYFCVAVSYYISAIKQELHE